MRIYEHTVIEIHLIREKERCTVSYFDLKRKNP